MPDEKDPNSTLPFKFVEVEWIDALHGETWEHSSSLPKPVLVKSRGWLIAQDIEGITIANSYFVAKDDFFYGEAVAIPFEMVRTIKDYP